MQQAKLLTLNLSLVRQVNKNRTTGANLQFLKFNRNVLVTHSYNWHLKCKYSKLRNYMLQFSFLE